MNSITQKLLEKYQSSKQNEQEIQLRFQHSLSVAKKAVEIIQEHHLPVDIQKAELAGIIHDYAKFCEMDDYLEIVKEFDLENDILENSFSVLHALLAPYFIRKDLNIFDEDILNAVKWHTTGKAAMTPLEEVLFLADFLEDSREEAGGVREVAKHDLKKAIALILDFKINKTTRRNGKLNNHTLIAYSYYRKFLNGELDKVKEVLKSVDHNLISNTKIYEMKKFTPLYDYVIIATALSERQMQAATNYIKQAFDVRGLEEGSFWTLVDLNDVLIHLFLAEERERYALDRLLSDAPQIIL